MMAALCIIPAKGYSRRLPNKNVLELDGLTLIARSVRSAIESQCFRTIAVSSDDDSILDIAASEGAVPLKRPVTLCGDDIRAKDVVLYHLGKINTTINIVAMLMNTNPFRTGRHIREAFSILKDCKADSVASVCEYEFSPALAYNINRGRLESYFGGETKWARENEFPIAYHLNGAIFLARRETLLKTETFVDSRTVPYVMDRVSSLDIDTEEDYKLAEAWLRTI